MRQIKLMITNGKQLSDAEAMALAQYAVATDLNPFSGECYYIATVGPAPGIAGWRKKGQEQLEYEAVKANENGCHFWIEEVELAADEQKYVRDGDVASSVILRDSVTNHRWRLAYLEMAKELAALGDTNALQNAKDLVGKEPTWSGFGIVSAEEKFSFGGGPEKMTRKERALKRAEKIAIRKRFPRIDLPELITNAPEPEDMIDGYAADITPVDINANLKALGYDVPEEKAVGEDSPLLEDAPVEPVEETPPATEPDVDPDYPTAPPDQPSLLDAAMAAGGVERSLAGTMRSWSPEAVNAAIPFTSSKDQRGKQVEAVNILNYSSINQKTATASLVKAWCELYRQCRENGMDPKGSAAAADKEILSL